MSICTVSPSARGWTTKKRCKSDLFKEVKRNEGTKNAGAKRKSRTRFGKSQSEVRTFERYDQMLLWCQGGVFEVFAFYFFTNYWL